MARINPDYIWVVAYINRDYINSVETDLLKFKLGAIKVFIPTVRILKKQFKQKNIYEYVPLLFNYGFFQLPYKKACDPEFLRTLKEKIPAIHSWVKDPLQVIKSKPNLRMDNKGTGLQEGEDPEKKVEEEGPKILKKKKEIPKVAYVNEEEIANLIRVSESMSVFSDEIVTKLEIGQFITLKGYPYEGMPAEIVNINYTRKQIKVRLLLECMITEAVVHFENIFYTVYSDYNMEQKEDSLDEIDTKYKRNLDKIFAKINYGEE